MKAESVVFDLGRGDGDGFSCEQIPHLYARLTGVRAQQRVLRLFLDEAYPETFYEWWPKLWVRSDEVHLCGSEPLLSEQIWEILDYFGDLGGAGKLSLHVTSPLSAPLDVVERWIMKTHYVEKLSLETTWSMTDLESGWKKKFDLVLAYARLQFVRVRAAPDAVAAVQERVAEFRPGFLQLGD